MKEIDLTSIDSIIKDTLNKNPELLTIADNIKKTVTYIFKEYEKAHSKLFYIDDIAFSVHKNACNIYLRIENPIYLSILIHCHLIKGCDKEIELERFTENIFGGHANFFKKLFTEIIDRVNKETAFDRFFFKKTLEPLLENNI